MSLALDCEWRWTVNLPEKERKKGEKRKGKEKGAKTGGGEEEEDRQTEGQCICNQ